MKRGLLVTSLLLASSVAAFGQSLTINTTSLPSVTIGQNYSATQQFTETGGPVSPKLAWSSTALPANLTMNPDTGTISGTPQVSGTFFFTVTVRDTTPGSAVTPGVQTESIQINPSLSIVTQSQLPNGTLNSIYSPPSGFQLSAFDSATSSPQLQWAAPSGLPAGLSLNSFTGVISGTPTTVQNLIFTVTVTETSPFQQSASKQFSINITPTPPAITQTTIPGAVQGVAYTTTLTATNGAPPYSWSIPGVNNSGLTINASTGVLSGTPSVTGTFPLTVVLTDSIAETATQVYSLTVTPPLQVLTTTLPLGSVGVAYSQTLSAGGGQAPYKWSITSGNLPPGLQLDAPGGLCCGFITGTPTTNGTYPFTVQVTDFASRTATGSVAITIGAGLTITSTSLPDAPLGSPYSQALAATGGLAPYTWSIAAGTLPAGLTLDPNSGIISGTPTSLGSATVTVQVTDATKGTAQGRLTINVRNALVITTSTLADGITGVLYSQGLAASGGVPPYTWSTVSGALPDGLTLSSSGIISGTPTKTGSFNFIVAVVDSSQLAFTAPTVPIQKSFAMLVVDPLVLTNSSLSGTASLAFAQTLTATGGTQPYTFSVSFGTLPAGLQLDPSSGKISGTATTAGTTSVTFTVTDSRNQVNNKILAVTIAAAPTLSITGVPSTSTSSKQVPVSVTSSVAPADALTGTVTLTFQGVTDDQLIQFTTGGRSVAFTIPAGQTQAVFKTAPSVITGTVAGTITLTAQFDNGGPAPTPTTIVVAPAAPAITTITLQQVTGGINVVVTGYSNTREVISGLFHFAPATNVTFASSDVTVQLGAAFTTWYSNPASTAYGSQFTLTMPFTLQNVTGGNIVAVTVTLTNTKGNSAAVTVNP